MWKFHDFSITQILREINFKDPRSAKSAIVTHLEALNFNFHEFLHFLKGENYQITKFRALKMAKMTFLEFLESQKLMEKS